ncbi:hypothetical protein Sste5344_006867 [Sporothrix stenoceras]
MDDDNAEETRINVFVARGMLIESEYATWLYGTAIEHAVLYHEVVATTILTETPYFQSANLTLAMPAPFMYSGTIVHYLGDPVTGDCLKNGNGCDSAWALRIRRFTNTTIYGAGLYPWYQGYNASCLL